MKCEQKRGFEKIIKYHTIAHRNLEKPLDKGRS